jgi:uncharacterized protein
MMAAAPGGPPRLVRLCRHPIKAIGHEVCTEMPLAEGAPPPLDRLWAVAHAGTEAGKLDGGWISKHHFVRGVSSAPLMAVRARLAGDGETITLEHPDSPPLTFRPDDPAGEAAFLDWLKPLWPEGRPPAARIVRARAGGAFGDKPEPYVALVNLASQRALAQAMGQPGLAADEAAHRWRANLWLDGLAPWAEFAMIGARLAIGEVMLEIAARITRCRATCGNPETGAADIDTLAGLQQGFGHQDFGVYARVIRGGNLRPGMAIETEACA